LPNETGIQKISGSTPEIAVREKHTKLFDFKEKKKNSDPSVLSSRFRSMVKKDHYSDNLLSLCYPLVVKIYNCRFDFVVHLHHFEARLLETTGGIIADASDENCGTIG
jgi:hypothetical protein